LGVDCCKGSQAMLARLDIYSEGKAAALSTHYFNKLTSPKWSKKNTVKIDRSFIPFPP